MENLFVKYGIPALEVQKKIRETFDTIFFDENEKFYFELDQDSAFMMDTGNVDARTEGMSYGMMMAVQMDRQDIFDKLWMFSKRYMWHEDGKYQGYFAWSVNPEGRRNAQGPAPDGEEYYTMALFFASKRWGDKEAPYDYSVQARDILRHCVHQHELVEDGRAMWAPENKLIRFVPEADFSDPSYHLPHFYSLFARWADEEDRAFWQQVADNSRQYLLKSSHPVTGMAAEYAEYDGTPRHMFRKDFDFYSDAYRVAMNIGLDSAWFGKRPEYAEIIDHLQQFLWGREPYKAYMLDGRETSEPAMHPVAVIATTAAGSLATDNPRQERWVKFFWETPLRTGGRRYYDNCLYFFCLLMMAGEYRIFE